MELGGGGQKKGRKWEEGKKVRGKEGEDGAGWPLAAIHWAEPYPSK